MNGHKDAARVPDALRYVSVAIGVLVLALGLGFSFNVSWATDLWPWPDGKFSYLFVGSVLAAMAAALIWIGMTAEWGALAAGTITVLVTTAGMSAYLFQLSREPGRQGEGLGLNAAGLAVVALLSIAFFVWSRRYAIRDTRPMPTLLKVSYALFVVVLVLASAALLLRFPTIFPWPLNPDSSVMFGCIFVGDAAYFLYPLLYPRWHNARAQLLSFLAYDLVLIVPFLGLFATVKPDHLLSLLLYVAVLVYSGLLALYYLFLNPATRRWTVEEA
jgi:hypothetical protein